MKTLDKYKFKNATHITMSTLLGIGHNNKYPLPRGNCFSVACDDGTEYRIVNFYKENLENLIHTKLLSWPIKILPIVDSDHYKKAVIVDERIKDNWYSDRYCETCCPFDLLPHNQKMAYVRKLLRGEFEEIECANGMSLIRYNNLSANQETKLEYSSTVSIDSGVVCCDHIPTTL